MKIFGYVQDENGEPLSGGSVYLEKDKTIGTAVSLGGAFILENSKITPTDNFVISYIGFETQYFPASQLVGKKIVLKEAITELNEIVITPDNLVSTTNPKLAPAVKNKNTAKELFQKYKTPISVVGALALITGSFFVIKKNI
jgi:hypothetical protein